MSQMVEPNSAGQGKCLGHALNAKAVAKSRAAIKENPAFKHIKMKPKSIKKNNIPKDSCADGSHCEEMSDIGKM
jgi:hypothetical protein